MDSASRSDEFAQRHRRQHDRQRRLAHGFLQGRIVGGALPPPEDVRKANLRNCDLRGAHVEGTDFYLVDLRGARLEPAQRRWLERCRAILDRE
jgi:uncharacterized protein YjbI with pentapeptide repeats